MRSWRAFGVSMGWVSLEPFTVHPHGTNVADIVSRHVHETLALSQLADWGCSLIYLVTELYSKVLHITFGELLRCARAVNNNNVRGKQ